MKKKILFIFIITSIIFTSCYKEGPVGPPGPRGTNGRDGADAEMPKVYYFDIQLNKFKSQTYNNSWITYSYIEGVTITDKDLVMAYVNLSSDGDGDNYWQALPFTEYTDNSEFFIHLSFGIMDINDDSGNND